MATYLLTWNPNRWTWDDYSAEAAAVEQGKNVRRTWSTGNRRDFPIGSRVFLLRQSEEPRGLIAAGVVVEDVVDHPHYDPERAELGHMAPRVLVEFDALIDVASEHPLSREKLDEESLSGMNWNVQASGSEIPPKVASALELEWAGHLGREIQPRFVVGALYTRFDILALLGMPVQRGGDPFTGYFRKDNMFFLLPTIGNAGATGHDYNNEWESEDVLRWYTKTRTSLNSPSVKAMLDPSARVHLFTRTEGRSPFKYEGEVTALDTTDESPVCIRWKVPGRNQGQNKLRLVEVESEVRDNLRLFASSAPLNKDRASIIARHTTFWVYDSDAQAFGPSKFLGYSEMNFARYERANSGDSNGDHFHGHLTRNAISSVCDSEYEPNPILLDMLGDWLRALFGPDAPAPRADTVFVELTSIFGEPGEELPAIGKEGKIRSVVLSVRERDPKARAACLAHFGYDCQVCRMNFAEIYGEIGNKFIHVHHLDPLGCSDGERVVDPIEDLRPVCPNCHAMLHKESPPFTIEELRKMIDR